MKCKCGNPAVYRIIIVKPANLPDTEAKVRGESWVILVCERCVPYTLK